MSDRGAAEKEVSAWPESQCSICRQPFPQQHERDRLCLACFKIDRGYPLLGGDKATIWFQSRLSSVQADLALERVKKPPPPAPDLTHLKVPADFQELLKDLLWLCHPDKHKDHPKATQTFQVLVSLRMQKRKKKPGKNATERTRRGERA